MVHPHDTPTYAHEQRHDKNLQTYAVVRVEVATMVRARGLEVFAVVTIARLVKVGDLIRSLAFGFRRLLLNDLEVLLRDTWWGLELQSERTSPR